MNKKTGIFLIALVALSIVSVLPVRAVNHDSNGVSVFLGVDTPGYVNKGHLYIEIDRDVINDSQVFSTNDTVYLHFFYDVAYTNFFGAVAPNNGFQCDAWFLEQPNATTGLYNITRFSGMFNGYIDGYDIGLTNFDISDAGNTTQEIRISLEEGWHTFSIVAAEYVSDNTHQNFHWEWVKDQVSFYVAKDTTVTPPAREKAKQTFTYESIMKKSEDMRDGFEWSMWKVRPLAEPENYSDLAITTKKDVSVKAYFNTTWQKLNLSWYTWDTGFTDADHMGKGTVAWFNTALDALNTSLSGTVELNMGVNYVVFAVVGFHAADPGAWYGVPFPTVQFNSLIYKVDVLSGVGPSFGILLSVSMIGLVAALGIKRFRK